MHDSVVAMLDHTADEFPARVALRMGDAQLTYDELRNTVAGMPRMLMAAGSRGRRVATVLPNSLRACIAPYAIAAAGAQHVPLNPQYTARELQYMLRDSAPRLLIVDDELLCKVESLARELPDCQLVRGSEIGALLASWKSRSPNGGLAPLFPGVEELAILQYTGGSSGFPKGVNLTHRAISTNISQREGLLPVGRGGEVVLCVMPLFHSYAMAMGLFLCGYSGSTLVVLAGYHPEKLIAAIAQHAITIFPGSPTIFTGLMACAAFASSDWSRVHTCYSGSAALSAETLERWEAATHAPIYEGYGQTEAGPVLTFNPMAGPVKVGSVGIPVAATEVQVVDLKTGQEVLPVGTMGEIRARGPQLMQDYHNLPLETREALRDGWLYTGDIGEFTARGFLKITDRKKDLIKTAGGKYIAPQKLEGLLKLDPLISNVLIHGDRKKYVVALITLDEAHAKKMSQDKGWNPRDYKALTQLPEMNQMIRKTVAQVNTKLASYETIKHFAILPADFTIESGELTPSLKVKRRVLDERYKSVIDGLY